MRLTDYDVKPLKNIDEAELELPKNEAFSFLRVFIKQVFGDRMEGFRVLKGVQHA